MVRLIAKVKIVYAVGLNFLAFDYNVCVHIVWCFLLKLVRTGQIPYVKQTVSPKILTAELFLLMWDPTFISCWTDFGSRILGLIWLLHFV